MVQARLPKLVVSPELYLEVVRENPTLRIERRRDGALIVVPPNGGEASRANAELTTQLAIWNRTSDGIVFDSSAGFNLPDGSTLSPDAAWIPRERWLSLSEHERLRFPPLCPDFVVELLSPSDDRNAIRDKLNDYLANGARLGWLIDPVNKIIEIYRPGHDPEISDNPREMSGEDVLPGFVLDLSPISHHRARRGGAATGALRI